MKLFREFNKDPWKGEITEQSVYERNEYYANRTFLLLTIGIFIVSAVSLAICYIQENSYELYSPVPGIISVCISIAAVVIAVILTRNGKLSRRYIKYCLFFMTELTILVFIGVYGFNYTAILFTIPVLISNRYPSKRFQTIVSASSIIMATAMPILCLWFGQTFKYVFFDHNQINLFNDTVIDVGESLYYSIIENFDKIDWYYTYLDTLKEASVSCFLMTSLFVFVNYLVVNAHRRSLLENETLINNKMKSQRDLLLAQSVQESALPENGFTDYGRIKIIGKMLPSEYVSGDFYDCFRIDDDKICLVVGDVSDHGLPSAMFMMSVRNTLRTVSDILTSPAEIMTKANQIICERNEMYMFATVWLGIIDLNSGIITYVNSGHPFPFIRKSSGEIITIECENNTPVGIFEDEIYSEYTYQCEVGDEIIIYTDGIIEANGEGGKQYGTDNFMKSIQSARALEEGFIDDVVNDLVDYTRSTAFEDDVTILTGKYIG